jgi:hypothetical protein
MTIRLNGSTSGYTEIDAPAVAGSNTLVLPTGNGTANQALVTDGSGTLSFADRGRMTLATAQNSTSGTAIDFTGIPSWVKKITVMFNGVSTNGSSIALVQLGAGTIISTGYACGAGQLGAPNVYTSYTAGFGLTVGGAAVNTLYGKAEVRLITGSTYLCSSRVVTSLGGGHAYSDGSITLSGTLDRVRITTANGTDTFDAGSINILYEG